VGKKENQPLPLPKTHTHAHTHEIATSQDITDTRYRYILTGSKVGLFGTESDLFFLFFTLQLLFMYTVCEMKS
jgi:hypothetical protein